jgi:polysaccharide export outer membrane protein
MLVCVVTPSSSRADEPRATADASEYRIGVEDVLDIAVRNDAELQKVVPVRPDGKVSLPLVNDVVAAGLTPMELRDVLTEKLSAYLHSPDVSVLVREVHSFKVSVIGNVRTPGRYEFKGPATVLDALALAGGFTDFAARRKISIMRREGTAVEHLRFDYDATVKNSSDRNLSVKPGDIIIVP